MRLCISMSTTFYFKKSCYRLWFVLHLCLRTPAISLHLPKPRKNGKNFLPLKIQMENFVGFIKEPKSFREKKKRKETVTVSEKIPVNFFLTLRKVSTQKVFIGNKVVNWSEVFTQSLSLNFFLSILNWTIESETFTLQIMIYTHLKRF